VSRTLKVVIVIIVLGVIAVAATRYVINAPNTTTTTTSSTSTTSTTLAGNTCKASDFSGAFDQGQGAAGTISASITLTKTTTGSCALKGWPMLTLQDRLGGLITTNVVDVPSSGNSFQFPSTKANAAPTTLTLAQNSTTNFSLAYSDVQTGTTACASAVTVSVQFVPRGPTVTVTPPSPVQPCNNGQIWVSPFY
jgi:hypothetical protein